MTQQERIESINNYIKNYPSDLPFQSVDYDTLCNDPNALNLTIDFIIGLFMKIGLSDGLSPSMDGIILDSCLEFLTELKEKQ
jgi:hypothetical protein